MKHKFPPSYFLKLKQKMHLKFLLTGLVIIFTGATVWAFSISSFVGMNGYAWSDNIGWVSMSCKTGGPTGNDICASNNYGVTVSTTTGNISGYAWSDHVGWISFNSADVSGCPVSPCAPKLTTVGLSGFAKALSGGTAESGGWDGYIDLSSVNRVSETLLSGYAWGSDVVGWLDMSGVGMVYPPVTASLFATPTKISYNSSSTLTWDSENANSCSVAGGDTWPYPGTLSGTVSTGNLASDKTYNLQCTGLGSPSPVVSASIDVCPSNTPVLNRDGVTCQNPPTSVTTFTGQYTSNGKFVVTGENIDSCIVTRNGVLLDEGVSPLTVNFSTAGTYRAYCSYTDANLVAHTSNSFTINYSTTPPPPVVSLKASPTTVSAGSPSVLTWTVTYPGSVQVPARVCTLVAITVCSGGHGNCNASQLASEVSVNAIIQASSTDVNDTDSSRTITPIALNEVTDTPANILSGNTDWKTSGKKTFILSKSTDFMLDCEAKPSEPNAKQGVRVMVTNSVEG